MSSFAYKAKNEICRTQLSRQCCARAEAYGVLLYCNTFTPSEVRIITENPEFAARLPKLFHKAFSLKFDQLPEKDGRGKLIFRITDRDKLARIINTLGYDPQQIMARTFKRTVTNAMKKNDAHRFSRSAFSSRCPKRMENSAPLPIHRPRIMEVRNVISVKDEPTAARASRPRKCPTISVSAML